MKPDSSSSSVTAEVILDAAGTISEKLPCASCGTYLIGAQPSGFCRECNEPAADSLESTRLCFSNYGWLAGISRSSMAIIAGAILSGVSIEYGSGPLLLLQRFLWSTIGPIILLYGVWQATSPEPRDDVLPVFEKARSRLRAAMLATIPLLLIRILEELMIIEFAYFGHAAAVVLLVFSVPYAREVARRIPDARIEKAFPIAAIGQAAVIVAGLLVESSIGADGPDLLLFVAFSLWVIQTGLFVWLLIVLALYRRKLRLAIDVAEERYMRQLTKHSD